MTHQSLSSTTFPALRVPEARFARVLTVCATIAPILLVIYACVISTDSMVRAHIVVQGCERIVLLLAAALILRAFYLFGVKDGFSYSGVASNLHEGAQV